MRVLFVCTANMCRSPMASALFRRRLAQGDGAGAAGVDVASAGLLSGGNASPSEVVTAMAELGIDLAGHRSVQVTPDLVTGADLVVGMARRHTREVVLVDPDAWPRTFTLKEIVRRGDSRGGRSASESLPQWLARLHKDRARADLVGSSSEDDVADPLGGPLAAYRTTASELQDLVDRLAGLLAAPHPARPAPG